MTVLDVASHLKAPVMCLCAAFSVDGSQVAVVASDGAVMAYETRTWEPLFKLTCGEGMMDAVWSSEVRQPPDRGWLAFLLLHS